MGQALDRRISRGSRASEPLYEYACHEGNYSLESILKGARLDEADAAKKGAQR